MRVGAGDWGLAGRVPQMWRVLVLAPAKCPPHLAQPHVELQARASEESRATPRHAEWDVRPEQ